MHDWRLVGRERELERLERLLGPDGGCVVLYGPGGVGKSRLAAELAARADAAGMAMARARGTRSSSEIPLGAIAPLLPKLGDRTVNLLNAARDALAERAGDRELLLVVDDAQQLDHMSASLVHHLVVGGTARVVATVRSGDPVSDAITALWKDGHAERIDVGPLSPQAIDELIDEALDGRVGARSRSELQRVSAGNPLALRELVLGSLTSGVLTQIDGQWRLEGSLTLSSRLGDLVGERLAVLDGPQREALEVVALGEPVAIEVLERLVDPVVLASLEDRDLLALVEEDGRSRARLVHPIHGEVARNELGGVRRRQLLRRLADAMAGGSGPDPHDRIRVGLWQLDSGAEADAVDLMGAARAAIVATDWAAAARLAAAADERSPSFEAAHCAGYARSELGEHRDAEVYLRRAQELASGDAERVLATLALSETLFRQDRTDDAEALVASVEGEVAGDDWRLELVGHRATFVMLTGRPGEALELVAGALAPDAAVRPLVQAAVPAVPCLAWDARPLEAIALAERAFAVHDEIWTRELFQSDPGVHIVSRTTALVAAGGLVEAEETAAAGIDVVRESGDRGAEAWFSLSLAMALHYQGRLRSAAASYRRSIDLFGQIHIPSRQRWALAGLAACCAQLGELDEAAAALEEADAPQRRSNRFNEAGLDDARAWLAAMRGELPSAVEVLEASADRAIGAGNRTAAAVVLGSLVRLGRADAAVDRLAGIDAAGDSPLVAAIAGHAAAAAAEDASALDAAADAFEALGARLWAAEASADASRAWHRARRQRQSAAAATRAETSAAACEGARTPALRQGVQTNPLTRRELEVARLAAEGLSSREIASRLVVSARTVENHLQRAYEKLGIGGRDELAAALGGA